jgi:heavy metal translocating P-type ATPase
MLGLLGGEASTNSSTNATAPDPSTVQFAREGSALDDIRQCVLSISGMWCASCAWLVEQTLAQQKGVVSAQVSFTSDTARVTYKPARTGEDEIRRSIASLGYKSSLLGEADESDPRVRARRLELLRVGIAFAFAMNVMMVNFVLYAGYIDGISPTIARFVPWLLFFLSLPIFVCAWPLFDRAVRAALRGAATMETLVCLGATTAFAYSIAQTLAGSYRVYYDTADMLLGLVLVGKFIEGGVRANATDALTLLYNLIPKKATVVRGGQESAVAISQLAAGDQVLVRPGERIPADGTVESGSATVDESLMTGEARPVRKASGDSVTGGTIATDAPLTVRVQRGPDAGTVAQMIGLVEEAFAHKTPAERMADAISRVFVPIVIALAGATAAALFFLHAPASVVMTRAVATLVIACPCALGIATPMAMSAGVGAAARLGVLIGDGGALETLTRLRVLVFDKTGTLTEGRFSVRAVFPPEASLADLARLEQLSEHPIGRAIAAYALPEGGSTHIEGFERIEGAGVRGIVNGRALFAGNARMVEAAGLRVPDRFQAEAKRHEQAGLTVIYWGVSNQEVIGLVTLGDTVRVGSAEAIQSLTQQGIDCEMVSGDSEATARAVAEELGLSRFRAGATPAEKADWIAEQSEKAKAERKGAVGMVGDGVNDAPALARADLGIAIASGADIAARAAQISLLAPDLRRIPLLLTLAQKTGGVMRQNLFWAFIYNLVCIPLAMLGFINPLWAAAAMLLSSATVIANTKRLQYILGRISS